jgi:hypothetical protein
MPCKCKSLLAFYQLFLTSLRSGLSVAIKQDTERLKNDNAFLKDETALIKEDTGAILCRIEELVLRLTPDQRRSSLILQRFLHDTASYAESIVETKDSTQTTAVDWTPFSSELEIPPETHISDPENSRLSILDPIFPHEPMVIDQILRKPPEAAIRVSDEDIQKSYPEREEASKLPKGLLPREAVLKLPGAEREAIFQQRLVKSANSRSSVLSMLWQSRG